MKRINAAITPVVLLTMISIQFWNINLIPNSSPCIQIDQSGNPKLVRFVAFGDYGKSGDAEQKVSELITRLTPEFIITTGDNNYEHGSAATIDENIGKYFSEYIFPYDGEYPTSATENRFFPSLGNHDWRTDRGQPYYDYFELPNNERYYQFSWGETDFFVLNSNDTEPDGMRANSIQAQWLKNALANSDAEWKIVFFHHPPFSSAKHGNQIVMQWPFVEWGASLILNGHEHVYERLEVDGLTYLVTGLGGKSLYAFEEYLPESIKRYRGNYGVVLIEICKSTLFGQFINIEDQVIDQFIIFHPIKYWNIQSVGKWQ